MEQTTTDGVTGTQQEYARHLGCSEAYVSKLKRQGLLLFVPTQAGQRVDFQASDALVAAARDPNKEGGRERWRQTKRRPAAGDVAADRDDGQVEPDEDGQAAPKGVSKQLYEDRLRQQVRREQHSADAQEIDLLERAGQLLPLSAVRDREFMYGRVTRDAVMAIEDRMAPHLTPELIEVLHLELKAALNAIAKQITVEPGADPAAGEPGADPAAGEAGAD